MDTGYLESAFDKFSVAIPEAVWTDDLKVLANRLESEISDVSFHECRDECDEPHIEDDNEIDYVNGDAAQETVLDLLRNLRMGYDIGSTEEILERLKKELEA